MLKIKGKKAKPSSKLNITISFARINFHQHNISKLHKGLLKLLLRHIKIQITNTNLQHKRM